MIGVKGLVGQQMSGQKTPTSVSYVTNYPAGSWTWTCPRTARYRFVQWGAGGAGSAGAVLGGGAGAHLQTVRWISQGQTVALSVASAVVSGDGGSTTVTLPTGVVLTALGGTDGVTTGAGAVASGGDVNVDGGSSSGATGGTSGGYGDYHGTTGTTGTAQGPGAGGGASSSAEQAGGPGAVFIALESLV